MSHLTYVFIHSMHFQVENGVIPNGRDCYESNLNSMFLIVSSESVRSSALEYENFIYMLLSVVINFQ